MPHWTRHTHTHSLICTSRQGERQDGRDAPEDRAEERARLERLAALQLLHNVAREVVVLPAPLACAARLRLRVASDCSSHGVKDVVEGTSGRGGSWRHGWRRWGPLSAVCCLLRSSKGSWMACWSTVSFDSVVVNGLGMSRLLPLSRVSRQQFVGVAAERRRWCVRRSCVTNRQQQPTKGTVMSDNIQELSERFHPHSRHTAPLTDEQLRINSHNDERQKLLLSIASLHDYPSLGVGSSVAVTVLLLRSPRGCVLFGGHHHHSVNHTVAQCGGLALRLWTPSPVALSTILVRFARSLALSLGRSVGRCLPSPRVVPSRLRLCDLVTAALSLFLSRATTNTPTLPPPPPSSRCSPSQKSGM